MKFKKIKVIIFLMVIVISVGLTLLYFCNNKLAKIDYNSKAICVMDADKNKIIFEKNANEKLKIASLTKLMTVLVAIEKNLDWEEISPVDVESYKNMVALNASMVGFYGRERVKVKDLLYGTMLASGGEAAMSLAIKSSGSLENFVIDMNEKAKELGLKETNFSNPVGMDEENNYSTARDMALLLNEAIKNEEFKKIFIAKNYTTTETLDHPNGINIESTVLKEISDEDETDFKILGGKSGTTKDAGLCWATLSKKGEKNYIIVVIGAPLDELRNPTMLQKEDTIKILEKI